MPPPPAARSLDPNADVVVTYQVAGGGTIRFTVRPRYVAGEPVTLTVDVGAGSVPIRGPLSGRILGSGLEGEKVIRTFGPGTLAPVEVAADRAARTTVLWDGRDDDGAPVRADTYSAAFDFVVGGESVRFGSVIQLVRP
ncbi:MAG TPA: hypothetical protein VFV20_10315 [Candidatus Limnocylindria bacterium]|nr:hypothetical protein [Candidatus Limnocylindria bacterium]